MGDAGDKLADRRHLFRVHQLCLQDGDIRDVGHHGDQAIHFAARAPHWAQVHREAANRLPSASERKFQVVYSLAFENAFNGTAQYGAMRFENDSLQSRTYEISPFPTGDLAATTVGIADQAGGVGNCN